jgi:hypothetical protein
MLDRLLRGRSWIGLLGVLLIGLVALNVSLLKLNAQAGRNAEIVKKLRVQNADLRGRVSRLGSGDRLQEAAAELGFVMPAAGSVHYLTANTALDARRAARHESLIPLPFTSDIVSGVPAEPLTAAPAPVAPTDTAETPAPAGATATPGVAGPTGTAAPETATQPAPPPTATQPTTPTAPTATTPAPAATAPSGGAAQP